MLLLIDCDTDRGHAQDAVTICHDCGGEVERDEHARAVCDCGTHHGPDHMA